MHVVVGGLAAGVSHVERRRAPRPLTATAALLNHQPQRITASTVSATITTFIFTTTTT